LERDYQTLNGGDASLHMKGGNAAAQNEDRQGDATT
jgi:hypothetical protein